MDVERAMVVHGAGLDEITIHDETTVAEVTGSSIEEYTLHPEDVGLQRHDIEAVAGGQPAENAADMRGIVEGSIDGAKRDIIPPTPARPSTSPVGRPPTARASRWPSRPSSPATQPTSWRTSGVQGHDPGEDLRRHEPRGPGRGRRCRRGRRRRHLRCLRRHATSGPPANGCRTRRRSPTASRRASS